MEIRDVIAQALSKIPQPQGLDSALSQLVMVRVDYENIPHCDHHWEEHMMLADQAHKFVTAELERSYEPGVESDGTKSDRARSICLTRLASPRPLWHDFPDLASKGSGVTVMYWNWEHAETIWEDPKRIRRRKAHELDGHCDPDPELTPMPHCDDCGGLKTDELIDPEALCICPATD